MRGMAITRVRATTQLWRLDGKEPAEERDAPAVGETMIPWAIDQSIPALAYPIRRHTSSHGPLNRAEVTWLIIQLNPNVLGKEIFPELTQKYFGSLQVWNITWPLAAGNDGERVVYSSGAGFGEEKDLPVDATLNLIGPPFGRGGPPDAGMEFFATPVRPGRAIALNNR